MHRTTMSMSHEQRQETPRPTVTWPIGLRLLVGALLIVALIAPLILWRPQIAALFARREHLVAALRGAGAWGPAMLIGLYVAQVLVAPIPGQAINFVAGYLYGFWSGLAYSWAGAVLGSTAAMGLARLAGRPLVVRLVGPDLVERLDRLAAGRGLGFFLLVFLIPGLPDDAACFLAGLTRLPLALLIAAAAIGRLPGMAIAVWAGASAGRVRGPGWAALTGAALLASFLVWRWGERFQNRLMEILHGCRLRHWSSLWYDLRRRRSGRAG